MDRATFYQGLSGLALSYVAGLLSRRDAPAPHFHFPACDEPAVEPASGWAAWTLVLALAFGYLAGSLRVGHARLRLLARRALRHLAAAVVADEPPRERAHREEARRPRALFPE